MRAYIEREERPSFSCVYVYVYNTVRTYVFIKNSANGSETAISICNAVNNFPCPYRTLCIHTYIYIYINVVRTRNRPCITNGRDPARPENSARAFLPPGPLSRLRKVLSAGHRLFSLSLFLFSPDV